MDKMEKNIETMVAGKALKEIHDIVSDEERKERQESRWGVISVGLIIMVVFLSVVYLNFIK